MNVSISLQAILSFSVLFWPFSFWKVSKIMGRDTCAGWVPPTCFGKLLDATSTWASWELQSHVVWESHGHCWWRCRPPQARQRGKSRRHRAQGNGSWRCPSKTSPCMQTLQSDILGMLISYSIIYLNRVKQEPLVELHSRSFQWTITHNFFSTSWTPFLLSFLVANFISHLC